MFVILAYDVDSKRVNKIRKITKKYLTPVQESVFEGFIGESKLNKLKNELQNSIDALTDSVIIYNLGSTCFAQKESLGFPNSDNDCIF